MSSAEKDTQPRISTPLYIAGWIFILMGLIATGSLVWQHFGHMSLPGCGPNSGCAAAAASIYGSIPGVDWPVSHIGLAYFAAMVVAWIGAWRGVPMALRGVLWLGALISTAYIVIMLVENLNCMYCLTTHVANFGLLVSLELGQRNVTKPAKASTAIGAAAAVFIATTAVLGVFEMNKRQQVAEKQEEQLEESKQRIKQARETSEDVFTGRYLTGPERAPIRMVMFTDYQCTDCQRIEKEIAQILEQRDDVSLSIKHFPMGKDCNPYLAQEMYGNACWAARAAEAAGILGGNEGFWDMHEWLFEHEGSFSRSELRSGVQSLGFEPQKFLETMRSEQTLENIHADIEEGMELGLYNTPMIFINGEELKGWMRRGAIEQAVQELAAADPPPLSPAEANDQPPPAKQKLVDDWRESRRLNIPPDTVRRAFGSSNPEIDIVMWADYTQTNCANMDQLFREWIKDHPNARYTFRHYPVNQQCNPVINMTRSPAACVAARAAEAVASVGGEEAFVQVHDWILSNQDSFSRSALQQAVQSMNLDWNAVASAMMSKTAQDPIDEDCQAGRRIGGIRKIPTIVINDRRVRRWTIKGENRIDLILDAATRDAASN